MEEFFPSDTPQSDFFALGLFGGCALPFPPASFSCENGDFFAAVDAGEESESLKMGSSRGERAKRSDLRTACSGKTRSMSRPLDF